MLYYNYVYYICASDTGTTRYASYSADPKYSEFMKKYSEIRADILPKCKALYDIIMPKLGPYLKKKTEIAGIKYRIEAADKYIQKAEERRKEQLRRHRRQVKYYETELKSCQEAYTRLTGAALPTRTVLAAAAPAVAAAPVPNAPAPVNN